ncbi:MAG: DUF6159 family protein [Balneolaceae bacterium]
MKSAFSVLIREKRLMIFPVLSGFCTLIIALTFFLPLFAFESNWIDNLHAGMPDWTFFLVIFLFYFVSYFCMIFFNSAAVVSAIYVLRGGSPSIRKAINIVMGRIGALAGWALIAATIGLIINSLENQSDKFGSLFTGILGLSWTVVSFLVLPILVIENKGPISSLKESARMLKHSWGEQLIGHFSFGLIFFLLMLPGVAFIGGIYFLGEQFGLIAIGIFIVYAISLGILQWILQAIFMGTVYMYVRDHKIPDSFTVSQLHQSLH